MSKQHIRIDHLEIRFRRMAPETACSAVQGLGQHVLDQLASQNLSVKNRAVNIGRVEPATLPVAAGAGPAEVRTAIGNSITNSIRSKLK